MAEIKSEIRHGTYYDSVVLMGLQAALKKLSGVTNVGVMMGSTANKELLKQNNLLTTEARSAQPDDLIISIEGDTSATINAALAEVENLLSRRHDTVEQDYLPKTLASAVKIRPDAEWILVSVPGNYAAGVTREALQSGKHVFLYSDNVPLKEEISLKELGSQNGLLVMGPDCGTAIINGVGFGFANRVRRGPIGLVGASGTGLQQVTSRIHQLGSGISHAIGTGGRDLSIEVGGITALQGLSLLGRDPETKVIVVISKPPDNEVALKIFHNARGAGKPVVINFIGFSSYSKTGTAENLYFSSSLDGVAELAVNLANSKAQSTPAAGKISSNKEKKYLRGIFSGGTLAYESLLILQNYLPEVYSNIPLKKEYKLIDSWRSKGHTIVDLGDDEFTRGRPHPMLDNSLRIERLKQEASYPDVAIILMDVVLGFGAHPDPASELAPAISDVISLARKSGRDLEVVIILVGTDEDPQDLSNQLEQFRKGGARVETSCRAVVVYAVERLQSYADNRELPPVDLAILTKPVEAINIGLESFSKSLGAQKVPVIHLDWRPPAGGDEKLISILERMKNK